MSEQPMVDLQGLAKHLSVSANTIRNWLKSGRIPPDTYIQINHTRRFFLHEVLEALRSDRVMEVKNPNQLELPLGVAAPKPDNNPRKPYVIDTDEDAQQ